MSRFINAALDQVSSCTHFLRILIIIVFMCFSPWFFVIYLLNVFFSISSFHNVVWLICRKASPNNTGGGVPAAEQWYWWKQWKQLTKTCWICMIIFFFSFYFLIKLTLSFICANYWLFIHFRQWHRRYQSVQSALNITMTKANVLGFWVVDTASAQAVWRDFTMVTPLIVPHAEILVLFLLEWKDC